MKIYIVGIGTGSRDNLTVEAINKIESADLIIGASRMTQSFNYLSTPKVNAYLSEDIQLILEKSSAKNVAILVSGDVGFFSATKKLIQRLKDYTIELIPGISSIVYFSAKVNLSWDNMKIISVHGREGSVLGSVMKNEKTFVLTGGKNKVNSIISSLIDSHIPNLKIYVGENLSYENEKITTGNLSELHGKSFSDLSVMIIENNTTTNIMRHIEDDEFTRGKVPMTKDEVRSIVVSKLRLNETDIVYDVGAGTGSVSVEIALNVSEGEVYAIEKNIEAVELIKTNREKFRAYNMKVISGTAPHAMEDLPPPNKVFIGGSSKSLEDIISLSLKKNPNVKIVVTAIALETVSSTLECFKKFNLKNVEIVQVNVSKAKSIASYNMMMGQNPVYIFSGDGNYEK